jgi:thiol-disulfide isomerase/thioredoxin
LETPDRQMKLKKNPARRTWAIMAPLALAAVAASAWVYVKAPATGKAEADCPAASKAVAERLAPLAKGDIAALAVSKAPRPAIPVTFEAPDGRTLTLDDFKGRALLVNLWATWCVPCRAEMPALDRLQAKAGGSDFAVLAINVDTARRERAPAFLDEIGVKSLTRYADPTADAFETLRLAGKALGLPTSLLIDKSGCEIGVVAGPANWDGADAAAALSALRGG